MMKGNSQEPTGPGKPGPKKTTKIVIRDCIELIESIKKIPDIQDIKNQLELNKKEKREAIITAIDAVLKDTSFKRCNPPEFGFEEDTDPD